MALNQVLISSTTISAPVTTVTIPVPSGYTDLRIVVSARKVETGGSNLQMRFNGSTSGYVQRTLIGTGSSAVSYSDSSEIGFMYVPTASDTANAFGNTEIYIPEYLSSNNKSVQIDCVVENNATAATIALTAASWANSAAISSVYFQIANGAGTFATGSSFALYGISKTGASSVGLPKATGGDIVKNDGTYWYHAFLSTGAFIPQTELTADVLVVAGGGSGTYGSYAGAGGGAGGYLEFLSQPLTTTSYTCTVGAGGASPANMARGNNGNNSTFSALTAAVGGGGAGGSGVAAANNGYPGGSGGGGATNDNTGGAYTYGGAGTAGQGYAGGGNGGYPNPPYPSGGGGGAGGVGQTAPNGSTSGNGGIGKYTALSDSIGVITSLGQLSGGHYYFAGGGGGACHNGGTSGAGGLGGGGNGGLYNSYAGAAGTVNTGGGGGSGTNNTTPGAGGSGIVIVRYAMA